MPPVQPLHPVLLPLVGPTAATIEQIIKIDARVLLVANPVRSSTHNWSDSQ